jgi:hypothetical protein
MNSQTEINESLLDEMLTKVAGASAAIRNSTAVLRRSYQRDSSNATADALVYRRKLYSEGVMYGTRVYPGTVELVKSVKRTLEYYVYLDYSDFSECVDEVRSKCLNLAKSAIASQHKHTYVLANLNTLEDEMHQEKNVLKNRELVHREKAESHDTRSNLGLIGAEIGARVSGHISDRMTAIAQEYGASITDLPMELRAIPYVGMALSVCSLVYAAHKHFRSKAEQTNASGMVISSEIFDELIESLKGLEEMVYNISGFMALMATDLSEIAAVENESVQEKLLKAHWKLMTKRAKAVVNGCKAFIAVEPAIASDLMAIKDKVEEGYYEKWTTKLESFEEDKKRFEEE